MVRDRAATQRPRPPGRDDPAATSDRPTASASRFDCAEAGGHERYAKCCEWSCNGYSARPTNAKSKSNRFTAFPRAVGWSSGFNLGRLTVVIVDGHWHALALGLFVQQEFRRA